MLDGEDYVDAPAITTIKNLQNSVKIDDVTHSIEAIPMDSLNFDNFHAKLKVIDYSNAKLTAFFITLLFRHQTGSNEYCSR